MRKRQYEITEFICPQCGNKFPLPRPSGRKREKGHIKDLWCPFCQEKVKFKEVKSNEVHTTLNGTEWE